MSCSEKQLFLTTCLVTIFLGIFGQPLYGQSTFGTILGAVTDPQSMVMPGVRVTLMNQDTRVSRTLVTNERGIYEFLNLIAGNYRVEISQEGFKTFVKSDVVLSSRQTVRVDAVMEIGTVSETVTVRATAGLIDSETSSLSGTVRGGEVHFLSPTTDSQRPWTLIRLNPLVQNTNSGTRFTMAGAYYSQAELQVDGISLPLGSGGPAGSGIMSSEAVQEVKILAGNNNAEYASPAAVQQISRGGGNSLRGDFYYYYNSPGVTAREATSMVKPSRLYHMFGGNIGGPVLLPKLYDGHERTFFSLSWQSKREVGSQNYMANVPLVSWRDGVFNSTIRNPFTGQNFPNNTIPSTMINPVSQKIQDLFYPKPNVPSPTQTTNNHQISGPTGTSREEVLDLRIDQRVTNKQWLYVRAGGTQFDNRTYDSNLPSMGFRASTRKLYTGVFSYSYTIQPTLLNEFRAGFSRDDSPGGGSRNGLEVLRLVGIQFPSDYPPPDTRGFPVIAITGQQQLAQQATSRNIPASYQLTETLSWIKGAHTFKGGANIFLEQPIYWTIPSGAHGSFTFQGIYTGQPYADFLLGIPAQTVLAGINPGRYLRSTNYGLFFQDDFKLRPNWTLNLGVRWDYQGPIYNKNDAFYSFDPATGGLIKASSKTPINPRFAAVNTNVPILEAAGAGLPERSLHFADKNNFAPRIGFAWRPRNSSTFVVRGGWGKFTDILGQGIFEQQTQGGFLNRGNRTLTNQSPNPTTKIIPASTFMFPYPFPPVIPGEPPAGLPGYGFNPHLFNPYIQQWNLTLEKALWETTFRASYIGTKSTNLVYSRDINQRRTPNNDNSRPYRSQGFGSTINYLDNGGNQIYHGFQLEMRRMLQKGLAYQVGYVWSKNISDVMDQSDTDAYGTSTDANNRALDRAQISYSRRHNLTAFAIWELPFGRGRRLLGNGSSLVNHLVSGWEFLPELFVASGQWATPCRVASNPFTGATCTSQTARPDRIGNGNDGPRLTGHSAIHWFNTSAFRDPAPTALGSSGRNILEGPGFWHASLSLTKRIHFRETKELWLTIAAMNIFNHPNFAGPSGADELTVDTPAFGSTSRLLSTDRAADRSKGRVVWLRARILF